MACDISPSPAPSPSPSAPTQAADLRTQLDLLLTEHVVIVAKESAAAINHSAEYAGYTALLATNENFNAGWEARLGSRRLAPTKLDGWRQGWAVPAGPGGHVVLTFGPDWLYRGGLPPVLISGRYFSASSSHVVTCARISFTDQLPMTPGSVICASDKPAYDSLIAAQAFSSRFSSCCLSIFQVLSPSVRCHLDILRPGHWRQQESLSYRRNYSSKFRV